MSDPSSSMLHIGRTVAFIALLICTACAGAVSPSTPTSVVPSVTPVPTSESSPTPTPTPTPEPTTISQEAQVEEILSHMTTEQKVGQLFMVYFDGTSLAPDLERMITEYHVGGIILFPHNLNTLIDLAMLISDAQQTAAANEPPIPLFVAADQEGWPIWRLPDGATVFPSNMALGATNSVDDARLMAQVMAEEMIALGINMNLAPVMDVNSNPANPIIGTRSLGSSPDLVSRLGTALIETYQAHGIVATAKHFPGHGDTSVDSHQGLPTIEHDLARLNAVELPPFEAAISAGVDCIMTAHIHVPALDGEPDRPATLSAPILQGLLREQMGFEGLIATDSLGMLGITSKYDLPTATVMAFEAGADLLLFGHDPGHPPSEQRAAYEKLLDLVERGTIPMRRLDDSVRRILRVKLSRGILDWREGDLDDALSSMGTSEHLDAARQVALHSITLVRDDAGLLPLNPEASILVVYPRGGAAFGQAILSRAPLASLLEVTENPTWREVIQASTRAAQADVVVVGTRNVLRYPAQAQLVQMLLSEGPLVAVALDLPYDLASYPEVPAYLATYGRATVSMEALADVLFGAEVPTGRLPVELAGLYPLGHPAPGDE